MLSARGVRQPGLPLSERGTYVALASLLSLERMSLACWDRVMPRQTDEVFEEVFLASLYDHFNTWDASDEFYLALARESHGHVLDLGGGTGMLACRIAQEGLSVIGADPAEGMLRVARSRQGTERVSWIKADGQTLRLPLRFVDQDHLMRLLAVANLTPIIRYGDWDRTPITPTSRELIVVSRRAD